MDTANLIPRTIDDLLALPYSTLADIDAEAAGASGGAESNGQATGDLAVELRIMDALKLDVFGEREGSGVVELYSEYHRKIDTVSDISKLRYERLLQLGGPPVKDHVLKPGVEQQAGGGQHPMSVVRDAIAMLAGHWRIGDDVKLGMGCWPASRPNGHVDNSVIIVGAGEAAEWDGENLKLLKHPRHKNHILDISGSEPWYDFGELEKNLAAAADPAWVREAMNETIELFSRWTWKQGEEIPTIVASLILATWVQTLWSWRPQIAVIGSPNTGKSTLFETLDGLFGGLSMLSSGSSAAGIRQAVKMTSQVILCDEFESSDHREEILDMMRYSGRGDRMLRGTSGQRGKKFLLQHVVWVTAVNVYLRRERDQSRFIILELEFPEDSKMGQLNVPSEDKLRNLGARLLAIALRSIGRARPLAVQLKLTKRPGTSSRIVESYAVPAAILAVAMDVQDRAKKLLLESLDTMDEDDAKTEADETALMGDIMSAQVRLPAGKMATVAQILSSQKMMDEHGDILEAHGISMVIANQKPGRLANDAFAQVGEGSLSLFVAANVVSRKLLSDTQWKNESLKQHLRRIPDAKPTKRRIGGTPLNGVEVPWLYVKENHLSDPEKLDR